MLEDFMTTYGSRLAIAVIGVGVGLVLLVVALYLVRRRSGPSPFLKGGKNRQPRLQVLDAAAVDARRRIVLIRRDNVEHLVMIGGPTDIVIETGIGAPKDGEALLQRPEQPERLAAPPAEPRLEQPEPAVRIAAPVRQIEKPQPQPTPVRATEAAIVKETPTAPAPAKTESREPPVAKPAPVTTPVQPPKPAPAADPVIEPTILAPTPAVQPPSRAMAPVASAAPALAGTPQMVPDVGAASDALDAARRRIFQPAQDRTPVTAPQPAEAMQKPPVATPVEPAASKPDEKDLAVTSEFDRILEKEMASNLAAEPRAPVAATFNPSLPKRDPATPKVTGATPDPSLQNEIARIFGEMSVTRDDRQG